jgi:16S rRNA (cytosine967-C5)-methyltransferase
VFAYYRWRGWLSEPAPRLAQIAHAVRLADRFSGEPASFTDPELAARAVPAWVARHLDVTPAWARALQAEPRLWLRARRGTGQELCQTLGDARVFGQGRQADALEYQGRADLFRLPGFHAGEFELQDLSSQAVGWLCDPRPGETWWDACAGEGGKLLHLSDLMQNRGLLWGSDRVPWRLQRLKRRAARARVFNYRAALWDGSPRLPTKTRFDGVLVDAPCSGLGTWQRNPHARWTTTPEDVEELGVLQATLLANAAASVKPGGKLVYAVCTMTLQETTAVADGFEQRFPNFVPLSLPHPLQPASAPSRHIWIWPQACGSNGMFIAVWRRAA